MNMSDQVPREENVEDFGRTRQLHPVVEFQLSKNSQHWFPQRLDQSVTLSAVAEKVPFHIPNSICHWLFSASSDRCEVKSRLVYTCISLTVRKGGWTPSKRSSLASFILLKNSLLRSTAHFPWVWSSLTILGVLCLFRILILCHLHSWQDSLPVWEVPFHSAECCLLEDADQKGKCCGLFLIDGTYLWMWGFGYVTWSIWRSQAVRKRPWGWKEKQI